VPSGNFGNILLLGLVAHGLGNAGEPFYRGKTNVNEYGTNNYVDKEY